MRMHYFKDYEKISNYMINKARNGFYTVAVLYYYDAIDLLRKLMCCDDVKIESLDIQPAEYKGYDKEYYVSIADDMVVSVEPAFVGGKYLSTEADLILIYGYANSAIIKDVPKNKCQEIYIGDYDNYKDLDCGSENDIAVTNYDNILHSIKEVYDRAYDSCNDAFITFLKLLNL